MDKETLSNYGWIVICVLVLAVMIALATPFGNFVSDAIKSTTQGLFDVNQNALNSTGLINIGDQSFGDNVNNSNEDAQLSGYGFYYNKPYFGIENGNLLGIILREDNTLSTFYPEYGIIEAPSEGVGTYTYEVMSITEYVNMFEMSPEEIEETINYLVDTYGVVNDTKMIAISLEDYVLPLCFVISNTELRTINENDTFRCDSEQYTNDNDYFYFYVEDNQAYLAYPIDPLKTTYNQIKTSLYNKPVILYKTYRDCENLQSIVIPHGITEIGYNTFAYCSNLTSITIPNGVITIGEHAFYECSSLTNVTIPNGVTVIGEGAFLGCTALETVTIPASITRIEQSAFALFVGHPRNGILKVYYEGTIEQWNNITENSLLSNLANSDIGGPTELYINGVLVN